MNRIGLVAQFMGSITAVEFWLIFSTKAALFLSLTHTCSYSVFVSAIGIENFSEFHFRFCMVWFWLVHFYIVVLLSQLFIKLNKNENNGNEPERKNEMLCIAIARKNIQYKYKFTLSMNEFSSKVCAKKHSLLNTQTHSQTQKLTWISA